MLEQHYWTGILHNDVIFLVFTTNFYVLNHFSVEKISTWWLLFKDCFLPINQQCTQIILQISSTPKRNKKQYHVSNNSILHRGNKFLNNYLVSLHIRSPIPSINFARIQLFQIPFKMVLNRFLYNPNDICFTIYNKQL